eukprot:3171365-Rhodomonas_salina.1
MVSWERAMSNPCSRHAKSQFAPAPGQDKQTRTDPSFRTTAEAPRAPYEAVLNVKKRRGRETAADAEKTS